MLGAFLVSLVAASTLSVPAALTAPAPAVTAHDFTVISSVDGARLPARFYRPTGAGPYPVVLIPHGGGGTLDSDAARAERYAREGFVGVVWTARGHGTSDGFYDLFGPVTVQDTKDVLTWVLANRSKTAADPERVGMTGYSQGGGTTNLGAAFDDRIDVIGPGHTFLDLEESLKPNGCAKASVDAVVLAASYLAQRARPRMDLIARWSVFVATGLMAAETRADWKVRSPRVHADQISQPSLSVQAFDDPLFPADHALVLDELQDNPENKLWLSWGGHFAPPAPAYEAEAREDAWHRWMQHWLQEPNGADREPRVTWWYKAADRTQLVQRQSDTWPPPGTQHRDLSVAGTVVHAGGAQGVADDPVVAWATRDLGRIGEPLSALPNRTGADTVVASTPPLTSPHLFVGAARASVAWTSTAFESQLIAKVWDVAPDGRATLLGRGCTMVNGTPGVTKQVSLDLWPSAVEVPAGHRVEAWIQAADVPFFLPTPHPSVNAVGAGSTVSIPLLPLHVAGADAGALDAEGDSGVDTEAPEPALEEAHGGWVAGMWGAARARRGG